jgi:hypothetical protein
MKKKIQIEYPMNNMSLSVLWNYVGSGNGLANWFAEKVAVEDKIYRFYWDDSEESAELISSRAGIYVRFRWLDEEDERAFFEFRISINELTADVLLLITDFVDPDEVSDATDLWNKQVDSLRRIAGIVQ